MRAPADIQRAMRCQCQAAKEAGEEGEGEGELWRAACVRCAQAYLAHLIGHLPQPHQHRVDDLRVGLAPLARLGAHDMVGVLALAGALDHVRQRALHGRGEVRLQIFLRPRHPRL